ncbi:MAG: hypothetical protein R3349_05820 [Geminicoccaceae bacterium]|nr:hypothetical protein [Geminicoccaceae bacterium]
MRAMPIMVGLLLAPLAVQAAPVSEATLQANYQQCVQECVPGDDQARCEQLCGCVTDKMASAWDESEFRTRTEVLEANPEDPEVLAEMRRFTDQCWAEIGQ